MKLMKMAASIAGGHGRSRMSMECDGVDSTEAGSRGIEGLLVCARDRIVGSTLAILLTAEELSLLKKRGSGSPVLDSLRASLKGEWW